MLQSRLPVQTLLRTEIFALDLSFRNDQYRPLIWGLSFSGCLPTSLGFEPSSCSSIIFKGSNWNTWWGMGATWGGNITCFYPESLLCSNQPTALNSLIFIEGAESQTIYQLVCFCSRRLLLLETFLPRLTAQRSGVSWGETPPVECCFHAPRLPVPGGPQTSPRLRATFSFSRWPGLHQSHLPG